jgi:hypothetical protein
MLTDRQQQIDDVTAPVELNARAGRISVDWLVSVSKEEPILS